MKPFYTHELTIEKILLACYVGIGQGAATHRNRSGHGLAFHTSGTKKYIFTTGETITVNKNDLIYLPKHSNYNVVSLQEGDCFAINFDSLDFEQASPFSCHVKNNSQMLDYFKNTKKIWETRKEGYTLKCKANLYNIIYLLAQEYFSPYVSKEKKEIIIPALEYIHENYTSEVLSIAKLANLCSISPEYFRLLFKDIYGISPKKYITGLKLTRAKELLESGMYSITEICFMSGYTDLCHFSREFKKENGVSPKYYIEDLHS